MIWPTFKAFTWCLSRFVTNQRSAVVLPDGYAQWPAVRKLAWLREQAVASAFDVNALPPVRMKWDALHTLCRMNQNLDHDSDLRPVSMGSKPLHPMGVTASVELSKLELEDFDKLGWESRAADEVLAKAQASGEGASLFGGLLEGCQSALIRVSEAVPYGFQLPLRPAFGHVPGMSLKCLVDGAPSADLVFLDTMEGQGDVSYPFERTLSSILSPGQRSETHAISALFNSIERDAAHIATAPLASVYPNGKRVEQPRIPYQLHFVGSAAAREAYCDVNEDIRVNLAQSYRTGDCLGYIYAARTPGELGIPILKLCLRSNFVASAFDDEDLFFRHNRKVPMPAVPWSLRCSRFVLSGFTWMFTAAFGANALTKRGRSTHTHGVAAKGAIEFSENSNLPDHPFFISKGVRSVVVRHANVIPEDDAKKSFRGMALRIEGLSHEGPLDILMNTGPRGVFWHARNFVRGVAAAGTYTEFALWLVQKLTPPMHDHMQLAARRAPEDYTKLYYYSRIALNYYTHDGVPRLARFRCRPLADLPDTEGLAPEGTRDRVTSWSRVRLADEKRPTNYLRSDFNYDMSNGVAHQYRLEIQTIPLSESSSNEVYSIKSDWENAPWQELGGIQLNESIDAEACERLEFGIHNMPRSLTVPKANSITDYRSIGDMRMKVYPRMQLLRRLLGLRRSRGHGLPEPHSRRGYLSLCFPIASIEAQEQLDQCLREMGDQVTAIAGLPLTTFEELHFARFVILSHSEVGTPGKLVYSANVDGAKELHLWRLVRQSPALHDLLKACDGYPGPVGHRDLYHWMLSFEQASELVYEGHPGRSVKQIHAEEALRKAICDRVERTDWKEQSSLEIVERLRESIRLCPELPQTPPPKRNFMEQVRFHCGRWFPIIGLILIVTMYAALPLFWMPLQWALLVGLCMLVIPVLGIFLLIRRAEIRDEVEGVDDIVKAGVVAAQEDHQAQNQLTMQLPIKAGWLRWFLIKTVFKTGHYLTRYLWYKGKLAGIPSIHFARFLIDDENRRMQFFSNYDGSWESYLSDFLTTGALAVVPIWTHCKGCPSTRFMFWPQAGFGRLFRGYIRQNQNPTQIWYSGYPTLAVTNINDNSEMRRQFWTLKTNLEAKAWLQALAR